MHEKQCQRCGSIMREEQILLASGRRAVFAYSCPSCGRNEYGTVFYKGNRPRNRLHLSQLDNSLSGVAQATNST